VGELGPVLGAAGGAGSGTGAGAGGSAIVSLAAAADSAEAGALSVGDEPSAVSANTSLVG
jgi:hypothetical protein